MSLLEMQKEVSAIRRASGFGEEFLSLKLQIRSFQNKRLAWSYADLLDRPGTSKAASFFLEYLYGTQNLENRDVQAERVLPKADKYLPSRAVEVLALVLEMDLLAEKMDHLLTLKIKEICDTDRVLLDDALYLEGFRQMQNEGTRRRQIELVPEVGERLVRLMRLPLLGSVLKVTRGAAQKANLEDFHEFLSSGVSSFKSLASPHDFFAIIQTREKRLLDLIFRDGICVIPDLKSLAL